MTDLSKQLGPDPYGLGETWARMQERERQLAVAEAARWRRQERKDLILFVLAIIGAVTGVAGVLKDLL